MPTASVSVPVEVAWAPQPALLLVAYVNDTATPLSVVCLLADDNVLSSHQSTVTGRLLDPNVPPDGVTVITGGIVSLMIRFVQTWPGGQLAFDAPPGDCALSRVGAASVNIAATIAARSERLRRAEIGMRVIM